MVAMRTKSKALSAVRPVKPGMTAGGPRCAPVYDGAEYPVLYKTVF